MAGAPGDHAGGAGARLGRAAAVRTLKLLVPRREDPPGGISRTPARASEPAFDTAARLLCRRNARHRAVDRAIRVARAIDEGHAALRARRRRVDQAVGTPGAIDGRHAAR